MRARMKCHQTARARSTLTAVQRGAVEDETFTTKHASSSRCWVWVKASELSDTEERRNFLFVSDQAQFPRQTAENLPFSSLSLCTFGLPRSVSLLYSWCSVVILAPLLASISLWWMVVWKLPQPFSSVTFVVHFFSSASKTSFVH